MRQMDWTISCDHVIYTLLPCTSHLNRNIEKYFTTRYVVLYWITHDHTHAQTQTHSKKNRTVSSTFAPASGGVSSKFLLSKWGCNRIISVLWTMSRVETSRSFLKWEDVPHAISPHVAHFLYITLETAAMVASLRSSSVSSGVRFFLRPVVVYGHSAGSESGPTLPNAVSRRRLRCIVMMARPERPENNNKSPNRH